MTIDELRAEMTGSVFTNTERGLMDALQSERAAHAATKAKLRELMDFVELVRDNPYCSGHTHYYDVADERTQDYCLRRVATQLLAAAEADE